MINYLIVLLAIMFITVIHEFGHFLCAKLFNVKVKTFSCGFGPCLASKEDLTGVNWKLSAIPLGGYVEFAEKEHESDKHVLFDSIHPLKRFMIAFAGPLTNIILSFLCFASVHQVSPSEPPATHAVVNKSKRTFNALFSRKVKDNIRSPVSLFQEFQSKGIISVIKFVASLSLGIGILNLIPVFFVLDGGHMLIYLYESIFGLGITSRKLIEKISKVQMYILVAISILLILRDIYKIFK